MIRDVDALRRELAGVPGYWPVAVEVVVGGDVDTDVVDLERIVGKAEGNSGAYLALIPSDDPYGTGTRELIGHALAARAAIDEAELVGVGWVRYTRDADGELELDHVPSERIVVVDEAAR